MRSSLKQIALRSFKGRGQEARAWTSTSDSSLPVGQLGLKASRRMSFLGEMFLERAVATCMQSERHKDRPRQEQLDAAILHSTYLSFGTVGVASVGVRLPVELRVAFLQERRDRLGVVGEAAGYLVP